MLLNNKKYISSAIIRKTLNSICDNYAECRPDPRSRGLAAVFFAVSDRYFYDSVWVGCFLQSVFLCLEVYERKVENNGHRFVACCRAAKTSDDSFCCWSNLDYKSGEASFIYVYRIYVCMCVSLCMDQICSKSNLIRNSTAFMFACIGNVCVCAVLNLSNFICKIK